MEIKHLNPDELPLWGPDESRQRELYELVRDNWFALRDFADVKGVRRLTVVSRAEAESQGQWPAPLVLHHRGAEYGYGGGASAVGPRLEADLAAHPRNVLIVVLTGQAVGEFVFNLDVLPAGVKLAGGDRPRVPQDAEEFLAVMGERRASILAAGAPQLRAAYRLAVARGARNLVLLSLDLSDRGARAVARRLRPRDDPKKVQARARKNGAAAALMHLAGNAEEVALALGDYGRFAAAKLRGNPPRGYIWHVIVAERRTQLLAADVHSLDA
jgi:hypothetical protein